MKYLILLLFAALFNICRAQFPDYYVYLVKGTVTVTATNAKNKKLKQGDFLFNRDVLIISKNSEITLVNKDAKYLGINTPRTLTVSTLTKIFPSLIQVLPKNM